MEFKDRDPLEDPNKRTNEPDFKWTPTAVDRVVIDKIVYELSAASRFGRSDIDLHLSFLEKRNASEIKDPDKKYDLNLEFMEKIREVESLSDFQGLLLKNLTDLGEVWRMEFVNVEEIQKMVVSEALEKLSVREVIKRLGIILGDFDDQASRFKGFIDNDKDSMVFLYGAFDSPAVLNTVLANQKITIFDVVDFLSDVAEGRESHFTEKKEEAKKILGLLKNSHNNRVKNAAGGALEGRGNSGGSITGSSPQHHRDFKRIRDPTMDGCRNRYLGRPRLIW